MCYNNITIVKIQEAVTPRRKCLSSPRRGNVLQRRGSLSPFRLCQQTEHTLLECWKSTWTSPNPSPLWACYRLVRNFVGRDHWSLFFLGKRAHCHGECSSIQEDDRRIFPSTSGRNGRRGCVVSTRRSHGPHSTGLDGIVEGTLPWPPHLSQRWSPLAGALSRFDSMRLLPMGLFEVYCLQRSTRDPSSPEDKHSERHRRNTGGHASESDAKLQKSTQSVHRQRRPSFDRCNFQKCMKKNLMRWSVRGKKNYTDICNSFVFINL